MLRFLIFSFFIFSSVLLSQEEIQYDFPKIKSNINLQLRIPLDEVGKMVNSSVKDLLFEDNSFEDNQKDQFKIKVWKTRPIRFVGGANENILIEVPLKIWAEKGLGTMGIYSYQQTTFETVMYFNTRILFNKNWTLQTNTITNGFKWIVKPVLDFGSVKIPITNLVEKSLKEEQEKFCKTIDREMKTQLDFRKTLLDVWNQFSEPINISEAYSTWLKITPIQITKTPLKFYRDEIQATFGIEVFSETFSGKKPDSSNLLDKMIDFREDQSIASQFRLQTTSNFSFEEATRIAEENFLNKEFDFKEGKSKIKINAIKVFGENERVFLEVQTEGYLNGVSTISGIPIYDEIKRKIVLKNSKYHLKSKNLLYKTASVLFQKKIVKIIEEEYGIPTQEIEDFAKKNVEEAFNKKYNSKIKTTGRVFTLKPNSVVVNPYFLTSIIDMHAELKLSLDLAK